MKKLIIVFVLFLFLIPSVFAAISPDRIREMNENASEKFTGKIVKVIDIAEDHECSDYKYAEVRISEVERTNTSLKLGDMINLRFSTRTAVMCIGPGHDPNPWVGALVEVNGTYSDYYGMYIGIAPGNSINIKNNFFETENIGQQYYLAIAIIIIIVIILIIIIVRKH